MTLVLCVVFTIVGISATPFLLRFMSMPDDVIGEATEYLMIYFSGVSGLMIYNMGAGVLRAVGDSKRPLYFLVFSACVNTVLDLVFVVKLHWGTAGVGLGYGDCPGIVGGDDLSRAIPGKWRLPFGSF